MHSRIFNAFYTKKHIKKANKYYSLLSATTGSCFEAFLDGIKPPIKVKTILNIISPKHEIIDIVALIFELPTSE